jgi:hypothetical protein
MADKEPVRTKSRAVGQSVGTRIGRRMALGGCALLAGAVALLVAYRYVGAPALGPPLHLPTPSPVIALGAVGLVCYTMFFLVCEAALLVLAIINIQDEKVHNKCRSLMLLVLYVFTFRYRRVLPAKFFAEAGIEAAKSAPAAGGPRKAGKHRQKRRETTMSADSSSRSSPSSPPSSPPVTDEEIRAAFTLLLTRMATARADKETAAGRAVADIPSHPHE